MTVTVALINSSPNPDRTFENFRRIVESVDSQYELRDYRLREGDLPDETADVALISGSPDSVYDDKAHVHELRGWIRETALPCMGVCYGHQAIADAYGGVVEELPEGELGYHPARHGGHELFAGVPERFVSFQAHGDAVTEPPSGAEVLAENDVCLQAMRLGEHFSVQFHPEIGLEYGCDLVDDIQEGADGSREFASIRETLTEANARRSRRVHAIFENYLPAAVSQ